MSIEGPEKFELDTLEVLLKASENPKFYYSSKWCAVFGTIGALLLLTVYFSHNSELLTPFWLYFLCILGGTCLSGAAIVNKLNNQSKIAIKYVNKEAIYKRISELKM